MKKWRIEYESEFPKTPLSYWVHAQLDREKAWIYCTEFEPPLPAAIPGQGHPLLIVKVLGVELFFASVEEVEHFLEVMRQKNMPSTYELAKRRTKQDAYANQHWLSRLPAKLKPWSKRQRLIPVVEKALDDFRAIWHQANSR